jgi:hypothetical protein
MAAPQARVGVGVLIVKHKEGRDLILVGKRYPACAGEAR